MAASSEREISVFRVRLIVPIFSSVGELQNTRGPMEPEYVPIILDEKCVSREENAGGIKI